jgi:hypothetical protein
VGVSDDGKKFLMGMVTADCNTGLEPVFTGKKGLLADCQVTCHSSK